MMKAHLLVSLPLLVVLLYASLTEGARLGTPKTRTIRQISRHDRQLKSGSSKSKSSKDSKSKSSKSCKASSKSSSSDCSTLAPTFDATVGATEDMTLEPTEDTLEPSDMGADTFAPTSVSSSKSKSSKSAKSRQFKSSKSKTIAPTFEATFDNSFAATEEESFSKSSKKSSKSSKKSSKQPTSAPTSTDSPTEAPVPPEEPTVTTEPPATPAPTSPVVAEPEPTTAAPTSSTETTTRTNSQPANEILLSTTEDEEETAADGKTIAFASEMKFNFFDGHGPLSSLSEDDIEKLMDEVKTFFIDQMHTDSQFADDFLDYDVKGVTHQYDAETDTFKLDFVSMINLKENSQHQPHETAKAMANFDFQEFIKNYAWKLGLAPFEKTEMVVFAATGSAN